MRRKTSVVCSRRIEGNVFFPLLLLSVGCSGLIFPGVWCVISIYRQKIFFNFIIFSLFSIPFLWFSSLVTLIVCILDLLCLPSAPIPFFQITIFFISFFKCINLFIYLFIFGLLDLRCCTQAFSSCSEQGLLFLVVCRLLIAVASLCCRARALGARASVVVAHRLWSTSSVVVSHRLSCSTACGIFPDQGSNPCSLHW